MLNINSFISPITVNPQVAGPSADVARPSSEGRSSPEGVDFVQGQWWKNHAAGRQSEAIYTRDAVKATSGHDGQSSGAVESSPESSDDTGKISSKVTTKATVKTLSQVEVAVLEQLKSADRAVRAHEMAHLAAAGGYATGGPTFKMQRGPDGKIYAVGGEVQIDMSSELSPESTVEKMKIVRRAALAPVDPSPQDQKVAAQATIQIGEALQQIRLEGGGAKDLTVPEPEPTAEEDGDIRSISSNSGRDLVKRGSVPISVLGGYAKNSPYSVNSSLDLLI